MAKKTFKQFQNDSKGLTDKQFGKLLDKKGVKRPDIIKKIKEDIYRKKYDVKKGGYQKTDKMDQSNKRLGDSKASHRDQNKDFAKYNIIKTGDKSNLKTALKKLNKESVKRDEYGDPIGGPKISKKKLKKNLASNEKDDKITRSESA